MVLTRQLSLAPLRQGRPDDAAVPTAAPIATSLPAVVAPASGLRQLEVDPSDSIVHLADGSRANSMANSLDLASTEMG